MAFAEDEETLAADRAWVRDLWQALRPHASDSVHVNFEAELDDDRVRATSGADKYRRLAALKAEWEPDNVFHHNVNIPPEATVEVPATRTAKAPVAHPAP